ncbi:MBG domain-containing protein, partial [uncultured Polaribacter sp.]|uniref:MBG domain-containing protein n=1 Tax=uncultured Polaribacter sp. TaxID=174711 RepID=UPI0026180F55
NPNYAITYNSSDLTITSKAITVTAESATKVYGESDPEFSYTSEGLVGEDALEGSLSREEGEDVGAYLITSSLSNPNYAITYNSSDLTITSKAITVTAEAKTKAFGESDPELSYELTSGSLSFDDEFTGSLSREEGESIGIYLIEIGTLSLGDNYDITFITANFEITNTASLLDFRENKEVKLYPNPVVDNLNFELIGGLNVFGLSVFDFSGRLIKRLEIYNDSIYIGSLPKGIYFMRFETDEGVFLRKIIKK